MKSILCAVCLVMVLQCRVLAEDPESDSAANVPDSTPLVRTTITTDPLSLTLGMSPNLSIERLITESVSAKVDGYWRLGGTLIRGVTGSVRYHFSPGLAGRSVGVFVRALQEDISYDIEVDGRTGSYTLRNEGVIAGVNYGSRSVWKSGFTFDWYAGLGWPFLQQEWRGAAPQADASLYRKVTKVAYGIDAGLGLGYSF